MSNNQYNNINLESINLLAEAKKPILTLNDFISGALAGTTQVLVGQPFDIVKVRLQTSTVNTSPIQVIKNIIATEGITAFYKGTSSPLIGMSFAVATQFTGYESTKKIFRKLRGYNEYQTLPVSDILISGAVGGFFYSFILSPMELFRIKLQIQTKDSLVKYNSALHAAMDIYIKHGIRGCYKALDATFYREIVGGAVYFGVYESLMQFSTDYYGNRNRIPITQVLTFGALSGFCLWLFVLPIDVVKSRMQGADFNNQKFTCFSKAFNHHVFEHGYMGLFKGIVPTLTRAPIVNAASFLVYEKVQQHLKYKQAIKQYSLEH